MSLVNTPSWKQTALLVFLEAQAVENLLCSMPLGQEIALVSEVKELQQTRIKSDGNTSD
ncbi:MAG: hypothetical protein ACLTE2_07175 [Eubacteriales bacterium]